MMKDRIRPSTFIIAIPLLLLISAAIFCKHYFPKISCPIKSGTGIECPGCGGTGASEKLLSGDLIGAFQLNALISSGILGLTVFCLWSSIKKIRSGNYVALPINLKLGCLLLFVIIAFTIFRNL